MNCIMQSYNMEKLADLLIKELKKNKLYAHVNECKHDGFIIRVIDSHINKAQMIAALTSIINDIMNEDTELYTFLLDRYEFDYNDCRINEEYVTSIVDIDYNGRLISVEFDLQ